MAALPLLSTSAEALVMALAEVGVATAAVAPVAPVAAAITFPVAALAVGAGAVAVRMGLVVQYLRHPSENVQDSQEDAEKTVQSLWQEDSQEAEEKNALRYEQ
ncbi:hypothetical protein CABS01_04787 [Colletotrichum abscissum]|uniref:uncharacterized protein n=1 Tax=Colletotrichum abscissum TaxID=1671311 RepID=UPI0027D727C4|nr:uncharacterized protein CABS01_04787 [Colletotrichum abscissum]KAK1472144.1 hypothetical protein CABS01_04787 [Colletotrichum abscissum]